MPEQTDALRQSIRDAYLTPGDAVLAALSETISLDAPQRQQITANAISLIEAVRDHSDPGVMQSFLSEYGLSTREGVALMCLAEALLRVPDDETIDELIQDKIVPHDWASHIGDSGSILVNASTWALMLTGRVLEDEAEGVVGALRGMVRRMGEPVIRVAVDRAMREMGEQFVLGETIADAIDNGKPSVKRGYTYSYDMLGEAARTEADALEYFEAYRDAIDAIAHRAESDDLRDNPGISVKLSALHPRYEHTQRQLMLPVLSERLLTLAQQAAKARVGLNIDAEEADRLEISLDVIEQVASSPTLSGWDGFGVVVQAYGQRAEPVICWLYDLAQKLDRRFMVRLVKGAYWDSEIKRAQEMGLAGFPVYTRKVETDVSYIACASRLLSMRDRIYPQFATHNAQTMAAVIGLAEAGSQDKADRSFEFQRLHGMGDALHDIVMERFGTRSRIYAPVGSHEDLLAYLVRRLLENGANSSFVNQIVDEEIEAAEMATDPMEAFEASSPVNGSAIRLPDQLYAPWRRNSRGWDINHPVHIAKINSDRESHLAPARWDSTADDPVETVFNPAHPDQRVGCFAIANAEQATSAVAVARQAASDWAMKSATARGDVLRRVADLYEAHSGELFALLAREAGKTLDDAIAELREAVDFLRYYALEAEEACKLGQARGVIVCISPWNFPLAIFTGQISAALAAGNCVIAKPAEQTPLIAARAIAIMHEAGVPDAVLQCLQGDGEQIGSALTAQLDIDGVCFTGSGQVARLIERQLAKTAAPDAMLIAETGGLNAMIVDSTALPEQAVEAIVVSAFRSAGQRCSALRVLYVQDEVADRLITMLRGAMDALSVGDPLDIATDVGPIIDAEARDKIRSYCEQCESTGRLLHQTDTPEHGFFIPPTMVSVDGIGDMAEEIFGPVLHVARFEADELDQVISDINGAGYGLTFGLQTRIDSRVQDVIHAVNIGNIYINRNQIGAIVGSQPFGGVGLSGTGPKAGGPHYLRRFRVDRASLDQSLALAPSMDSAEFEKVVTAIREREGLAENGRESVLRQRLRGQGASAMAAAAALDRGPIDLPGPTGESNQLRLAPVGVVLCLSSDAGYLLDLVIQALAGGNRVVACGSSATRTLRALSDREIPLVALDGGIEPDWLSSVEVDMVAAGPDQEIAAIRQVLAAQDGAIARLLTERLYPAAFCHEISVCIDTTAAGGNTTLLAESGQQ